LQCVAGCCRVLQCVAVCCSMLQCVAVCCSVLIVCCSARHLKTTSRSFLRASDTNLRVLPSRETAASATSLFPRRLDLCCSVLHCAAVSDGVLQCVSACCVAVSCSVLQCVAARCSMLYCIAVCCVLWYTTYVFTALYPRRLDLCCSVLQCVAGCCSVLQCVVMTPSLTRYFKCVPWLFICSSHVWHDVFIRVT